ncbi:ABC transporter ATP-binding protein [Aggregatibacter actinomycetemcomitans]|uniref:ABC transporter ATP-binding protein n=1 Tax=Aggregatibacter actinomycetemcomitans TaxID=714 RepID=UPI00197C05E3|nr:ABC transporter ATP-binding protein [Aggregatibacter actinomycetemcomitans]MBN6071053.1 ABC transporter ATP-binding protein [Aggregatibacter actinomycetemcomitans]
MIDDIVVNVQNASVCFNKASGNISGLKEYVIKLLKRELMFQEFFALKGINFQVKRGESWGLIGTNGSGKSTLLKLISGIIEPYTGSVEINGSVSPLIELGAGFDSELTARENIFLNGALLGYSKIFMEEHFKQIVNFAEVNDFLDVPIKNFSSGMSARLGFAIATATKPNILIVDEVLAVGDYAFQQKCKARMEELLSGGTTLLFVSHSIEQVKTLCQYAVWIDKGIIREQGDVQSVSQKYMSSFN